MILYAEHEFAASTFAARVTAALCQIFIRLLHQPLVLCEDPCMVGLMKQLWNLFNQFKNPDEAEAGIREMLAQKKLIMGFGHRVYKNCDPRNAIIKEWSENYLKLQVI